MIKARVKKAMATVGYGLGLTQAGSRLGDSWKLRKGPFFLSLSRKVEETYMVLIYHRVNDEGRRFRIETVPTACFRQQMEYLERSFNVLPLADILARLQAGTPLPKRCVAITFDDGYEDNYLHAFPILERCGLPATIFVTTGCIGGGRRLWFDQVLEAFSGTTREALDVPEIGLSLSFSTPAEKSEAAMTSLERLKGLAGDTRSAMVARVVSQLGTEEPEGTSNQMLTWEQVRRMAESGISFGSHTVTHPILSKISIQEAEWEVTESKRVIESQTGRPVSVFAYPNGRPDDFSPETVGLLKRAGYQAALTTVWGANTRREDRYALKRVRSWDQDLASFALSLSYYYLATGEQG